jgi:glycosyltransferase involved in cell wall biosynthesis
MRKNRREISEFSKTPWSPKTMNKKTSVILPCYNGSQWIGSAIKSILDQTYKNLELLIIDDGSTDNSSKEIFKFQDNRIRYFYQKNTGFSGAINRGIKESNGEFICFIGQDDIYLPKKMEIQVNYLNLDQSLDLIHSSYYEIDTIGKILTVRNNDYEHFTTKEKEIEALFLNNYIGFETVLVRKKCFDKFGLFDEQMTAFSDHDMWLRLAGNIKIGYLNLPLVKKMLHKCQLTNATNIVLKDEFLLTRKAIQTYPFLFQVLNKKVASLYYEKGLALLEEGKFGESRINLKKAIKYQNYKLKAVLAYLYPHLFLTIMNIIKLGKNRIAT